jgi:uncharacterized membrane protein YhaH (DUF805 family)
MDVDFGSLLFNFKGRINRAKYWLAVITYISAVIALTGMGFFFRFHVIFFVIASIITIVLTISSIAVHIKRLHDRDKNGWWLLLFYLLPIVLSGLDRRSGIPLVFSFPAAAVSIWALVEFGFLRGTSGPNQYGPNPLGDR